MNNNEVLNYLKGGKNVLAQGDNTMAKNSVSNSKGTQSGIMNNEQVLSYLTGGKNTFIPYSKEVLNGTWVDKTKQSTAKTENKKSSAELFEESEKLLSNHGRAIKIEQETAAWSKEMAEKKQIYDDLWGKYNETLERAEKYGYTDVIANDLKYIQKELETTGAEAEQRYVQLYNLKYSKEQELKELLSGYSSSDELYSAWQQTKKDYEAAELREETEGYVNSDDFKENSAYSAEFSNDEVYQYINGANTKENSEFQKEGYGNLTDTEISIYNYIYKTKSAYSAERFLKSIQESIRYRRAEERFEDYEGNTFKERLFAVEAGWDQFTQNMDSFLWGDTDTSSTQYLSGMIRGDLSDDGLKYYNAKTNKWENIKILGSSTAQIGYDFTSTVTTLAPSILTSAAINMIAPGFGSAVGNAVMGASIYGGAYSEAINLGYDRFQANTYASLVAAAESGLNYLLGGIGKLSSEASLVKQLSKLKVFDNVFARVALSGAAEGLEEGLQTALDPWFKSIAAGVDFEAANIEDVLYDSLIGFLSGGLFETIESTPNIVKNLGKNDKYFNNSAAVESFIKDGLEMSEGSDVRKLAEKLSAKFDRNKTPTKSEVSDYVAALKNHIKTEYAAKAEKTAQTELIKKGESLDVGKLSTIIKKAVAGETVSAAEAQYLHQSSYGEQLLSAISAQVEKSVASIDTYVKEKFNQKKSANGDIDGEVVDNTVQNGYNSVGNGIVNGVNTNQGNISEEQRELYTAAILRYKSSESYKINAKLRDNEVLSEAEQEFVDTLDAALQSLPTYEGTVYRNLVFDDSGGAEVYNDFVKQHVVGEPIFYNQFVSCSKTEDGYTVDGEYKVQIIVEGKQARDVDGYGNNMENEVIFTRDTFYIVKQVETNGQYPRIYLQEAVRNGHHTIKEPRTTVRNVQESHIGNSDLQGVSRLDTNRDTFGAFRPQSTASGGQRNTVRAEGRQGTVLSTASGEQKVNTMNSEADLDDKSAFSMDENGVSQSSAKGVPELDISKDTRSHEERVVEKMSGKENAREKDRREVKRLGKLLGWEVRFDDIYARDKQGNIVYMTDKDGRQILDINGKPIPKRGDSKVNKEKKIITFDYKNSKPIKTLLKHELTHFLETNAGVYRDFLNKVIESDAFKNWLQTSKNTDLKTYRDSVIEKYKGTNGFETAESSQISAEYEMVAEFVEENLFGDGTKMVNEIVKQMNTDQRSKFAQFIDKIFEKLKNFFKGQKQLSEIESLEQEWLKAYKAAEQTWQQQKNTTDENSGEQYAINESFYNEFEAWDGKDTNKVFTIGTTSDALKSVNIKNQEIKMRSGMILQKLKKHPEMSKEIFKRIPELLEHPVIIQFSDAIDKKTGKSKYDSRITVLGELYADMLIDGQTVRKPVLVSLELLPTNQKGTKVLDVSFITSAYAKDALQQYINENSILYIEPNRKRTNNWLSLNRLQLPLGETEYGPIRKITYSDGKVKIENSKHLTPMEIALRKAGAIDSYGNIISKSSENDTEEYSLATDNEVLLSMYESGEITREEFLKGFNTKSYGLKEITDLNAEDADVLQPINKIRKESDGDSDSKFWESLQKSKWFDDGLKAEFAGNEFIEKYKSVSNKETLLEAKKELEEGGADYVRKWHNLDAKHASLIDTAVGFILLDGYRRNGDTVSAVATAEKLREIGTAGGQQIQIFSILGRLSPEAMLQYAQNELDKAFKIMVEKRSKDWIDKNKSKFSLTKEDMEFIERRVLQASILPEGRDKAVCMAEIAARLQDKLPPARSQGFKAWQRISMLLNPKTNGRNFLGNATIAPVFIASDFFGTGIDKLISKKTGIRTTGMFGSAGLKENAKAFKKGAWETLDDFKRHINTRNQELNRFDLNTKNMTGKSFNENHDGFLAKQLNDCAKVLNALDRMTSFCLEMGDRPFYEMWFVNSINNQMKLNNVKEPTPEMITIASAEALQRTWQDSNSYVTMVQNIKQGLNSLNIHGYGLGDVFVKFSKTPANLTKAIVDFSPVGLVKGLSVDAVNFKNAVETGRADAITQKKFVDSLSKGIAGTMLYILFAALAANGLITGAGDEDKDANAMEKYILGVPEYSIKLFGKWWSYEWMQPVGGAMAIVADYMQNKEENPDNEWYENIIEAIRAGGEVLYNQSFMQSLQTLFTADGIIDGVVSGILDDPSVLIPQFVSQIASATDKYRRVTYSNKNPWETALNKVKVKIPGIRQSLEIDKDILGRDIENSQGNFFDAFLNPANTYIASNNDVTDELYNLYKSTGDKTVIPRKAANSVTVKGQTHYFEIKEKNQYQKVMGETTGEILEDIFKSSEYKTLTDSEKVKLINNVFNYAVATAKAETVIYYDVLSAIYGDALSETKYNSLSEKSKKALAAEYFLSDYYDSKGKSKIKTTEAEYFLEKIIENKKKKSDQYSTDDINKIISNN